QTLRLDYPLSLRSVVLDAGGYKGEWAAAIAAKYGCVVHVFEPVEEFATQARRALARYPSVHVHAFGLAGHTREESFLISADGSSALRGDGNRRVLLCAAADVLR